MVSVMGIQLGEYPLSQISEVPSMVKGNYELISEAKEIEIFVCN